MDLDKLLENLAVISETLKTPGLTNQIDQDPDFGDKVKKLEKLVEKVRVQHGFISLPDDNLSSSLKEISDKLNEIDDYCNLNLQKLDFLKNIKPLI
tara:strand:+ start:132 stop:419 length:288 start_codon:yes stop_codon:yes gene_type:complete